MSGTSFPRRARRTALALLVTVLPIAASGAVSYSERVYERMLPNGLQLILLEDHKAPVVVFQLWYRVGSRNEVLGKTGLSHLMEHMMFKGTEKVAPEEYSRIIQRNGGDTNAFTTRDYTTYFATLASDRIGVVVELEADRMSNLVIQESLYTPERDVVKEERRLRTENNPVAFTWERLNATAYAAHPYQFPIIGWMTDIAQSTADDLREHYRTYYVPNNAFIVAVGDFDAEKLAAEIEAQFGSIPSGDMPPFVRSIEPPQHGERRLTVRRPAELPFVALAYHVPNLHSKDAAALEVMAELLSGGESSRLYQELVYRRRLARYASAAYDYTPADPELFTLYAQPLGGVSTGELEKALLGELEKVKRVGPSVRELQKAKNGIESQFIFAQDSLFYQGLLLGQFEVAGGWRLLDEYLPAIRAVTAEDVLRVARFYFDAENRTVAVLDPLPTGGPQPAQPAPPQDVISR